MRKSKKSVNVWVVNPKERSTVAKKRRTKKHGGKGRRTKNPANPTRRRRRRRMNGHRRSYRRFRHNPTEGKLGAILFGALAGGGSELADWGIDQITAITPGWQAVASGGAHALLATGGAFIDTRLEAGVVACGVKSMSQRLRVMSLMSTSSSTSTPAKKGLAFDRVLPENPEASPKPLNAPVPGTRAGWPVRGTARGGARP